MAALFQSIGIAFKAQGAGAPFVAPKPAGLVVGNLMVSTVYLNTGGVSTINFPAGWTKLNQREPAIGNPKGALGFKVADAADVAATDFTFTHTEGSDREWVGSISRYSGALNIDTFSSGDVSALPAQTTIVYPSHTTVVDNTVIHRSAGWDFDGIEASSIGLTALHTRRGLAGGFLVAGTSNTMIVIDELDAIVTPAGFVGGASFTATGQTGNLRAVLYTAAIAPLLFTLLNQADIETRKRVLMSKGMNLAVVVANPGSAVQSDTPGLYLVKDPQAGVGGFGKPPESAADARGDANDGWKLYSYDDVGTAYNL